MRNNKERNDDVSFTLSLLNRCETLHSKPRIVYGAGSRIHLVKKPCFCERVSTTVSATVSTTVSTTVFLMVSSWFPRGYQTVSSKARSWLQCLIGFPIYGLHQGNKAKLMLSSATYWLQHQRLIFTSRWIHDKVLAVPSGGTLSKGLVIITTTTMPSHHDRSSHPLDTFLQKSLSFGHGPSVG